MIPDRDRLSLRRLWLTHRYATGERAFPLSKLMGPSRRDGADS